VSMRLRPPVSTIMASDFFSICAGERARLTAVKTTRPPTHSASKKANEINNFFRAGMRTVLRHQGQGAQDGKTGRQRRDDARRQRQCGDINDMEAIQAEFG